MPHVHTSSSSSTSVVSSSHFQLIVIRALKTYNIRTKEDLFVHPLADQLRDCDSPGAILSVLQEQVQVHNDNDTMSRRGHERLTHFLEPTVNLLHTFSLALDEGVGFDIPLTTPILAGVGVLILAARGENARYDVIADVFKYIVYFFRRLELYSEVSPTNEMKDIIAKMLAEVLSILAIVTKEIKQHRMEKWLKMLFGPKSHIGDALGRLNRLTQDEARRSTSQVLKAIIMSKDEDINKSVPEILYDGKDVKMAMQENVKDVDEEKRSLLSSKLISPYDSDKVYGWEKDDSPPRYTPAPAYGTPEIVSLLLERGSVVETEDDECETSLDGLWDPSWEL